jgi:hypothetical protein
LPLLPSAPGNRRGAFEEVRDKCDRTVGLISVPQYQYPMLVIWGDITDPTRVELVDPAASFGAVPVNLNLTDKPVSAGMLNEELRWLGKSPATRVFAKALPTGFSPQAQLDRGIFISRHLKRPDKSFLS